MADDTEVKAGLSVTNHLKIWKAGKQELLVIYTLALISLMVALVASVIVTALPVSAFSNFWASNSVGLCG